MRRSLETTLLVLRGDPEKMDCQLEKFREHNAQFGFKKYPQSNSVKRFVINSRCSRSQQVNAAKCGLVVTGNMQIYAFTYGPIVKCTFLFGSCHC